MTPVTIVLEEKGGQETVLTFSSTKVNMGILNVSVRHFALRYRYSFSKSCYHKQSANFLTVLILVLQLLNQSMQSINFWSTHQFSPYCRISTKVSLKLVKFHHTTNFIMEFSIYIAQLSPKTHILLNKVICSLFRFHQ